MFNFHTVTIIALNATNVAIMHNTTNYAQFIAYDASFETLQTYASPYLYL